MKHHEYPKWIYSASGESKLVNDEAEHAEAGADWKESPAEFDKKSDAKTQEPTTDQGKAGKKGSKIKETDLLAMTVKDLQAYLVEMGMTEEDFKGLKKDELVSLAGNI